MSIDPFLAQVWIIQGTWSSFRGPYYLIDTSNAFSGLKHVILTTHPKMGTLWRKQHLGCKKTCPKLAQYWNEVSLRDKNIFTKSKLLSLSTNARNVLFHAVYGIPMFAEIGKVSLSPCCPLKRQQKIKIKGLVLLFGQRNPRAVESAAWMKFQETKQSGEFPLEEIADLGEEAQLTCLRG